MAKSPGHKLGLVQAVNISDKFDIYTFTYSRIKSLWMSRFKWINLPDFVRDEFLERELFTGSVSLFRNDRVKTRPIEALPWVNVGPYDKYNEPTHWQVFGRNFRQICFNFDSVICYDSKTRFTGQRLAQYYAYRLAKIEKEITVNVNMQKYPVIVKTTKTGELTAKNFFAQVKSDAEAILVYKDQGDFTESDISTLDLNVPEAYLNLNLLYVQIWNQMLTTLGIDNANQDKREREIGAEVASNNQQISLYRNSCLDARKFACKRANSLWGTNIDVMYAADFEKEGNQNVNVDDSTENDM